MTSIKLYDLLGVAGAPDPDAAAADLWPFHLVQGSIGARDELDEEEARFIVQQLQNTLTFQNVRPGAAPDRVGITAEMQVGPVPPALALVLTALPDFAFHLLPTTGTPARVAVTTGDLGTEVVIEALPVEIKLPVGLLVPLEENPDSQPPPEEVHIDGFVSGQHDTLKIVLCTVKPSSISVHVKIRMTEDGRFVVEPAVPLSVGACRFFGLPCRGIHDLNLFPAPRLGIGPDDEDHFGDQALEWTRHPILDGSDHAYGVITMRTIDLHDGRKPFSYLRDAINPGDEAGRRFEWVLEDMAFPIGRPVPLPSHFLAGLRRELGPKDDPNGAYNIGGLSIPLKGAALILRADYLLIEQLLFRSVAEGDFYATEGERQMAFVKLALTDDPVGAGHGVTLELAEDWTILAGWRHDPGRELFRLFNADFSLIGARLGLSIKRLADGDNVYEAGILVGDLKILLEEGETEGVFGLKNEGKVAKGVVVNDFGVRFGGFQAGSFWKIDGAKLKAFDIVTLEIEEYGLVTEPSGALYLGFSGSIPLPLGRDDDGDTSVKTGESESAATRRDGIGFRFYRLRGKIYGPEEAPYLLIDGIGLKLRYGRFGLSAFGLVSETVRAAHRYKEAALGLSLELDWAGSELALGGSFLYGRVSGPVHKFRYGMAGLSVTPIPLTGAINLENVRLLFAWNMAPNLGPVPAGAASAMRLYQWYEANRNAVDMPEDRNLALTGWTPQDDAWTAALGAGLVVASKAVTLDGFFLFSDTPDGKGLLAGLKIFLLRTVAKSGDETQVKSSRPIGYAVFEMDGDRWSVAAGLNIGPANVIGEPVPFLSDTPLLTGSFYHSNKPGTTAIGQFADPSTWLALHVGGGIGKKYDLFTIELFAGMCLELVDLPEGPRVFAARLSVSGGSRLFKVGGIDFYLTFQVTVGVWRTESRVSGFVGYLEGSLNIHVFYVLNFGATARAQLDYLGPDPVYRRFFFDVRIDTPWWLPDTSFRWSRLTGEAAPERMNALTTPLVGAGAHELAQPGPVALPAISPVVGNDIRPDTVYNINDFAGASGAIPQAALEAMVPVAVDSALSLVFNASVDDRLVFGQNTVPGVGSDVSGDLATRYELVEFGIRRKPRGAPSGWSFLVDPALSRMETLDGLPSDVAEARRRQRVRMRWDADFQREGRPDARRLLINTDTPYLTAILHLEADEALVRNVPGWPCCPPEGDGPVWHSLDFRKVQPGVRVPSVQYFTDGQSTLHWRGIRPPIAGPGQVAGDEPRVARLGTEVTPAGVFARLSFDQLVRILKLRMAWRPFHLNRALMVNAFRGLEPVGSEALDLSNPSPGSIMLEDLEGITEVLLSFEGEPLDAVHPEFGWIEWIDARYRTLEEVRTDDLYEGRCEAGKEGDTRPGGRFAWLPNHDYEIQLRTRVTVTHETAGELVHEVLQTLRFQTRGLPGLNRPTRPGAEFEPFVESEYPRPGQPLYRDEAVMLALNEKSDMFRAPDPARPEDPAERRQQIDWALVVRSVGGAGPAERISSPGADWIVENRTAPAPPGPLRPPIDVSLVAATLARSAPSLDPLWQRFEIVRASPYGCGEAPTEPPSRVLSHAPHDPDPDAAGGRWPARALHRAAVQIRPALGAGPSAFVDRAPFAAGDETALSATGGAWDVRDGTVGPAADTSTDLALALFGEPSWTHLQLSARVDPAAGEAGLAIAVRGTPASRDAAVFLIDATSRQLRALRSQGGGETVADSALLPEGLVAPFRLEVAGYDDRFVAAVGEAEVSLPRWPADRGRPAMAVRGAGRILELQAEPVDLYAFDFETSRFADFAAHVGSWHGRLDPLPVTAPARRPLAELWGETPVEVLMAVGADRNARQRAFDEWTAGLGVLLHTATEQLEISRDGSTGAAGFLLVESPEPIPFSSDVRLTLTRTDDGPAPVPLGILADAAECRAFLLRLDAAGVAVPLEPGSYEMTWHIDRRRYRAGGAEARYVQETVRTFVVE